MSEQKDPQTSPDSAPASSGPGITNKTSFALTLLLSLTALVTTELCFSRQVIGQFQDDGLYFSTAQNIAQNFSATTSILPQNLPASKYPPLYPLLLSIPSQLGLEAAILLQALLAALAVWLLDRLYASQKVPTQLRLCFGLVFCLHPTIVQVHAAFLSESLCLCLLAALWLTFIRYRSSRPTDAPVTHLIALALLAAAIALTRSAAMIIVLGLVLQSVFHKQKRVALSLGAGIISAMIAKKIWAAMMIPSVSSEQLSFFGYYLDYSFHINYYLKLPLGQWPTTAVQVFQNNAGLALQSLGRFFDPGHLIGLPLPRLLTQIFGAVFLGLCFAHNLRRNTKPKEQARSISVLTIVPYLLVLCFWSWTFSARFWLPCLPVLFLGMVTLLKSSDKLPRVAGIIGLILILPQATQLPLTQAFQYASYETDPGPKRPIQRYFYQLQQYRQQWKTRPIVLISDFHCFYLAHECNCQAIWLATLLPRQRFLNQQMGLEPETLNSEEITALGERLVKLQSHNPKLQFLIHADFRCRPWFHKVCQQLASQGTLHLEDRRNGIAHYSLLTSASKHGK